MGLIVYSEREYQAVQDDIRYGYVQENTREVRKELQLRILDGLS